MKKGNYFVDYKTFSDKIKLFFKYSKTTKNT